MDANETDVTGNGDGNVTAWPQPTDDQIALVARILTPRIHRARAEFAQQSAA